MIPSGIEPATFRFVAQYLNHCGPNVYVYQPKFYSEKLQIKERMNGSVCFRLIITLDSNNFKGVSMWKATVNKLIYRLHYFTTVCKSLCGTEFEFGSYAN